MCFLNTQKSRLALVTSPLAVTPIAVVTHLAQQTHHHSLACQDCRAGKKRASCKSSTAQSPLLLQVEVLSSN